MKLIVTGYFGDKTLTVEEDIKTEFERIMKEGYAKNVPAVFHAKYQDGKHKAFGMNNAMEILKDRDSVTEVWVIPLCGGG